MIPRRARAPPPPRATTHAPGARHPAAHTSPRGPVALPAGVAGVVSRTSSHWAWLPPMRWMSRVDRLEMRDAPVVARRAAAPSTSGSATTRGGGMRVRRAGSAEAREAAASPPAAAGRRGHKDEGRHARGVSAAGRQSSSASWAGKWNRHRSAAVRPSEPRWTAHDVTLQWISSARAALPRWLEQRGCRRVAVGGAALAPASRLKGARRRRHFRRPRTRRRAMLWLAPVPRYCAGEALGAFATQPLHLVVREGERGLEPVVAVGGAKRSRNARRCSCGHAPAGRSGCSPGCQRPAGTPRVLLDQGQPARAVPTR